MYSLESVFYLSASIVIICCEDDQWLVLVIWVHCHFSHCTDDPFILRLLKLWRMKTLHLNTDCDSGGGKLVIVPLSSLREKNIY